MINRENNWDVPQKGRDASALPGGKSQAFSNLEKIMALPSNTW